MAHIVAEKKLQRNYWNKIYCPVTKIILRLNIRQSNKSEWLIPFGEILLSVYVVSFSSINQIVKKLGNLSGNLFFTRFIPFSRTRISRIGIYKLTHCYLNLSFTNKLPIRWCSRWTLMDKWKRAKSLLSLRFSTWWRISDDLWTITIGISLDFAWETTITFWVKLRSQDLRITKSKRIRKSHLVVQLQIFTITWRSAT